MTLATTPELAGLFRVPPGTIRRWATEDGWARYGTARRRLYDVEDVTRSVTRRSRGA